MKFIKSFLMLLALATIALGLQAMSYESDIFHLADAEWCSEGGCENTNVLDPTRCTTSASIIVKSACNELGADCKACVDYTFSSCVCGTGSDFCMKEDHSYYYGTHVECDIDK
jgi:hypothetical protein